MIASNASALIAIRIISVVRLLGGGLLDLKQHVRQRRLRPSRRVERQDDDAPRGNNVIVDPVDVVLEA